MEKRARRFFPAEKTSCLPDGTHVPPAGTTVSRLRGQEICLFQKKPRDSPGAGVL
jgi:hypothetical protein